MKTMPVATDLDSKSKTQWPAVVIRLPEPLVVMVPEQL